MANSTFENAEFRMPHSIDAEKAVISCLLQNNSLIDEAQASISEEMFYDIVFREIFKSICELKANNFIVDKITVTDKINRIKSDITSRGINPQSIDDAFFIDVLRAAPITANMLSYCNIIKEKYILRKAISLSESVIVDCRNGEKTAEAICNDAQGEFFKYSKTSGQKDYKRIDSFISEIFDDIALAEKMPNGITGVSTGYKSIDNITAGFQKTDMIVIAARPGQGKTSFALNLAYNMARLGKSILFFSLEMGDKQLAKRILSSVSMVSSQDIRTGRNLNDERWKDLINAGKLISGINFYVDDDSYLTIAQLRNKCMKMQADHGLDAVFIDYLQLMHAGTDYKNDKNAKINNREQELAEISRNIKAIAKELDIPVIALAQLNRAAEKSGKPQLSDLRESGAIEQDADIVILLNRPNQNSDDSKDGIQDDSITEVNFAKHRNGSTESIKLRFDKATTMFKEFDKQY